MKKFLLYLTVFVFVCMAVLYGIYRWIDTNAFFGTAGSSNILETFEASEGDGSTEIGEKLEKQGLIRSKYFFYFYVWKTKTNNKIQAGEYELARSMTIGEMVEKFIVGDVKSKIVRFTVPEGYSNKKIVDLLSEKKPALANEFENIVNCKCLAEENCSCDFFSGKYEFLKGLPKGVDMEGYLFPDTYFIAEEDTGATLVSKFLNNYQKRVWEVFGDEVVFEDSFSSLHKAMVIASLLEREIPISDDRQLVSGIIEKRLGIGMALQIDATICYLKEPQACLPISSADKEIDSPYNTYLYNTLPPGPIGNPGYDAIKASFNPKDSDYLFYLSDPNTQKTIFATNYDQHLLNIDNYLKK